MTTKPIHHFEHFMVGATWRVPVYADGTFGSPEMTSSWNKPVKGSTRAKSHSMQDMAEEITTEER